MKNIKMKIKKNALIFSFKKILNQIHNNSKQQLVNLFQFHNQQQKGKKLKNRKEDVLLCHLKTRKIHL